MIDDSDAPFRIKDLHLYMHSFNVRTLGLIPYTVNGEMRFYCVSDHKCLRPDQVNALRREFMLLLEEQVARPADRGRATPQRCSTIRDVPTADGMAMSGGVSVLLNGDAR